MLDSVLKLAKDSVGLNEKDGSFKKIIDTYNTISPLPRGYKMQYTDEWCATFISYLGKVNNCNDVILPECSCNEMIKLYAKKGIDIRRTCPKIGDLIFYSWKHNSVANHIGIIYNISVSGLLTVIEGNKSERVDYRQININSADILGYITPEYGYNHVYEPSTWAKEYWDKATKLGITDGENPKSPATREQVVTMLGRLGLLDK